MSSPVGTRAELVGRALEALRAGRPVLVADSEDREDEVDVILSAALATPAWSRPARTPAPPPTR